MNLTIDISTVMTILICWTVGTAAGFLIAQLVISKWL